MNSGKKRTSFKQNGCNITEDFTQLSGLVEQIFQQIWNEQQLFTMTGFICLGRNQHHMLCFVMLEILKQISIVNVNFFFKVLTPQSQLSQVKVIHFPFLTRQTSINLKSFHQKHSCSSVCQVCIVSHHCHSQPVLLIPRALFLPLL